MNFNQKMSLSLLVALLGTVFYAAWAQTSTPLSEVQVGHTPVLYANPYENLVVTATTNHSDPDYQFILFFRGVGKKLYEPYYMRPTGNNIITGIIPQNAISTKGVAYFIAVRDAQGNEELLFGSAEKPHIVEGHAIVILKSKDAEIYEDVVQGLHKSLRSDPVVFNIAKESEMQKPILARLRNQTPEVIITVGPAAAEFVRHNGLAKKSPVVHAMLPSPHALDRQNNATGIFLDLSTQQVLSSFKAIIPQIQRVGVIYDPSRTERIVQEAKAYSPSLGFQIIATRIEDPAEVAPTLRAFEKNIDAFWLIPDGTVLRKENYPAILEFSRTNRIPLFVFSPDLVKKGALVSLSPDFKSLGMQTGELVQKILEGADPTQIPFRSPEHLKVTLNMRTARDLKLEGIAGRIIDYAADNDYPLRVFK